MSSIYGKWAAIGTVAVALTLLAAFVAWRNVSGVPLAGKRMIKLYHKSDAGIQYWETWDHNGVHTVHWGKLGERGESKELKRSFFRSPMKDVQAQTQQKLAEGYQEIPVEKHHVLLVEYVVQGMGTTADLGKRHRLEERMDETLGWTALGHCDGGSTGSGTMEVCCLVVDFDTAAKVIEADLRGTEFADYTRIYREDAQRPTNGLSQ
jgi:hypothetical protein